MKNDQRRDPRRPIDILLNKYVSGQPHICRGINMSRGGMLIDKGLEPDVPHLSVTVELELPGSPEVLCVEGVVLGADRDSRAMAIRFLRMPQRIAQLIERFIEGQALPESIVASV